MKVFYYIFCLCYALTIASCQKEDKILLKGCCENPILSEKFGNAEIYLPNIFTPNNDGINDLFYLQGDSVRNVINLEIRKRDFLIFQVKDVEANDHTKAWDGKFGGIVQKGLYSVFVVVEAQDGTIRNFESKICNYPCGLMDAEEIVSIEGCHFPDEWNCWIFIDGCLSEGPPCFE